MHNAQRARALGLSLPVMCGYVFLGIAFGATLSQAGFGLPWALGDQHPGIRRKPSVCDGAVSGIGHLPGGGCADRPDGQCAPPVLRAFLHRAV